MNNEENKPETPDKIDTLREDLYSRGDLSHTHSSRRGQKFQHKDAPQVKDDWTLDRFDSKTDTISMAMNRSVKRKTSFLKLFLGFSVIFFLCAVAVASYVFYAQINVVSTDSVNIQALLPVSIPGGEVLALAITVENNNNADLESAELKVAFPDGTKRPNDIGADLTLWSEQIGTIGKNGVVTREVGAVLFGEENKEQEITVTVEYRVKGSNALLYKEKKYYILLTASPVSMSVVGLKEIQSGQEVLFSVNLVSNSKSDVNDLLLKADYPFGFSFKSASPVPSFNGKNIWKIDQIKPSQKKTFKIHGTIEGQNEEERIFRFHIGIRDKKNEKNLGTAFLSVLHPVRVTRPFIGVDVAFDGERVNEYVTRPGSTVRADVLLSNNLSNRIVDSFVEVKLLGNLFNPFTVSSDRGFYRSSDNTILWDQTSDSKLALLEPGKVGTVGFGFGVVPSSAVVGAGLKNPEMSFTVSVKGKRVSETSVPEEITAIVTKKIKLATEVNFTSQSAYLSGPIQNRGPLPPKVDNETTYTVIWTLVNTSNAVSGGEVRAILPSYVKWLGVVSPSEESVDFQPVGGMITWNVGEVKSYAGISGPPREVAFQVSITPSLSQLGQLPVLVKDATFVGTDDFTDISFRLTRGAVTTGTKADPGFKDEKGVVVQ